MMCASRSWFVVLFWLLSAQPASAQSVTPQHRFCRDPHRLEKCGSYLLLELSFDARVAGTDFVPVGCTIDYCHQKLLQDFIAADIGIMKNLDDTQSAGASFEIGGSDDGVRMA